MDHLAVGKQCLFNGSPRISNSDFFMELVFIFIKITTEYIANYPSKAIVVVLSDSYMGMRLLAVCTGFFYLCFSILSDF